MTQHKTARALLDYEDLILATRDCCSAPGVAPWVLFKLDGGLDHILIDEAQDTNPEQWQIVAALAEEFFAGEGAQRGSVRTIFAVGDRQAIDLQLPGRRSRRLRAHARAFQAPRRRRRQRCRNEIPLTISFRSTAAVLEAVERGVRAAGGAATACHRRRLAGARAVARSARRGWSSSGRRPRRSTASEPAPWAPPTGAARRRFAARRLARLIAARIAAMIRQRRAAGVARPAGPARRFPGAGAPPRRASSTSWCAS